MSDISAAISFGKLAVDALRSVLALMRDAKDALPDSVNKSAIELALNKSEDEIRIAEAQLAHAFGYPLCRCAFPPNIMLKIGYRDIPQSLSYISRHGSDLVKFVDVYECPVCHQTDARGAVFQRLRKI